MSHLQVFLEDGNLNPGIHEYSMEDFEKQFIKDFATSETRLEIYEQFCEWLNRLTEILPPSYIWLDGSYLTSKVNPNDLDLVVFYRPEDIVSAEMANDLDSMINKESRKYDCDAYLCFSLGHLTETQKSNYGNHSIMETYWMGQFTFDRSRRPKGMVEITAREIEGITGGVTNEITSR